MTRLPLLALGVVVTVAVASGHSVAASADSDAALRLRVQTTGTPARTLTIDLQRWSSDGERAPLLAALTTGPAAGGGRTAGGRGSASGAAAPGSGSAPPATAGQGAAGEPQDSPAVEAEAPVGLARGAAGRAGAGGRGARGGGGRGAAPNVSPVARLSAAVKAAPTVGYVWGGGVTGYSIKYAWRTPITGRPERLVLVTDRRLDVLGLQAGTSPEAAADFTVIEIRFEGRGTAQGKTSLSTAAIIDQAAETVAVQDYDALPLQLRITP